MGLKKTITSVVAFEDGINSQTVERTLQEFLNLKKYRNKISNKEIEGLESSHNKRLSKEIEEWKLTILPAAECSMDELAKEYRKGSEDERIGEMGNWDDHKDLGPEL